MSHVVHFPARPDAPVACDLSTAEDTAEERAAEYVRLFERALLRRKRRDTALVLTFSAAGGTHDAVRDLARREAACCPFLDYRVQAAGDEVIWTISGSDRAVDAFVDAVGALV